MIGLSAITTSLVLVNLVDAWLYGSLLAAVAVSLTLVFGLGRVVNFAIGTFYALGAYCAYAFNGPLGYWPAIVCSALCVTALAGGVERIAIRPLRGRTEISTLLATFGLTILLDGLMQVVWGTSTFMVGSPVGGSVSIARAGHDHLHHSSPPLWRCSSAVGSSLCCAGHQSGWCCAAQARTPAWPSSWASTRPLADDRLYSRRRPGSRHWSAALPDRSSRCGPGWTSTS